MNPSGKARRSRRKRALARKVDGLNAGQRRAYDDLVAGKNVFLTGKAGTGKTYVLDAFLDSCGLEGRSVLAMAPTGVAALNLRDGVTVHRALGIKPHGVLDPAEAPAAPRKELEAAKVIVVDEVSMLRIDLAERVFSMILKAQKTSGRKQVVLVGDFSQLPPVVTGRDEGALLALWPDNPNGFAFKSPYWKALGFRAHILDEVVRQADPEFVEALNAARVGDATCVPFFNRHALKRKGDADPGAIWLCPTNSAADRINGDRLDEVDAPERAFYAVETGELRASDKPTADRLVLKEGARVMALRNDPGMEYQNGSLGTVVKIGDGTVTVEFDNGSSCRIEPYTWEVRKSVVRDGALDDGTAVKRVSTECIGTFTQVPLRLAWAITIHKSQGQTYERCVVDTRTFAPGQLYVALSRCSSAEGLQVYPKVEERHLTAEAEVLDFYRALSDPGMDVEDVEDVECPAWLVPEVEDYIKTRTEERKAEHE